VPQQRHTPTGDALVLKHRKYKDRGDPHAGENDFQAAWQKVVAQARKAEVAQAEETQGREVPVIYTNDRHWSPSGTTPWPP
jgi:hypothetical protein